jgi:hypothetical protein
MYPNIETQISQSYLSQILTGVIQPPCLIGGWAVYFTVNDRFHQSTQRDYPGSRDIDLGFHLDPNWTSKQYKDSSFAKTVTKLEKLGFERESYRFSKRHHMDDGRELSEEEAKQIDQYLIFNMFVDLLVDSKDSRRHKLAGFTVLEEPMLEGVFSLKEYTEKELFGVRVLMPNPQLLTKIKCKSFPGRPEEDKKIKDLMDICGLLLYSGESPQDLKETKSDKEIGRNFKEALKDVSETDWNRLSNSLAFPVSVLKRIALQIVV